MTDPEAIARLEADVLKLSAYYRKQARLLTGNLVDQSRSKAGSFGRLTAARELETANTIDALLSRLKAAEARVAEADPEQVRRAAIVVRQLIQERFGKTVQWSTGFTWAKEVLAAAFAATPRGEEG